MEQKILASVAFRHRPEADVSVGESSKFKFRSASFAAATRACNGIRKRCHHLGPGLIAGAADDDPSGIATYSQVGAQFGYSLGWVLLLTGPLLVAIQEISARVGHVTAQGIAANLRQHQSAGLLRLAVLMLLAANIMNLGADIGAMGAALKLLIGGPEHAYAALFGVLCLLLMLFMSYMRYVAVLKWLCVSLLAYVASAIMVHVPWRAAASGMFIPSINFKLDYLTAIVALLGTTISPYVFFWQAQLEAENQRKLDERGPSRPDRSPAQLRRIRLDTLLGAGGAMLIALCIMGSAAATLNVTGNVSIQTSAQAAEALRPIAGDVAFALFAAGIIGTGMLAVPALAASAAYAVAEALDWPNGLARRAVHAKAFYATLGIATLAGLAMNLGEVDPVRALYWSAVLNGLLAPPLMALTISLASSQAVMGELQISHGLKVVGWTATAVMSLAAVGMLASSIATL